MEQELFVALAAQAGFPRRFLRRRWIIMLLFAALVTVILIYNHRPVQAAAEYPQILREMALLALALPLSWGGCRCRSSD